MTTSKDLLRVLANEQRWTVAQGDCLELLRAIPDDSIHVVVTSPPYYGLRSYSGIVPTVWGGDPDCAHEWGDDLPHPTRGNRTVYSGPGIHADHHGALYGGSIQAGGGKFCQKCGAWQGHLGNEPIHDCLAWADPNRDICSHCYICHLVRIFREIRRVLHPSGTAWLNLGDSYAGSGKGPSGMSGIGNQEKRQGFVNQQYVPPGMKPKDLLMIPARAALALEYDGWYLRSDNVWCLSGGTAVYIRSPKGEMPVTVKDLARMDYRQVQLWNGTKWTPILGMSSHQRANQPIEITLRSGERIGCTPNHQWPTERGLLRTDELRVGDVLRSTILPEPEQPTTPDFLDDEEIGWFVGVYLAEGSRSGSTIQIACHKKETPRFKRLKRLAEAYHGLCRMHPKSANGNGATINIEGAIPNAIIDTYIVGRTAKDKHLTTRCWQRSNRFLRALLIGYLEGDGHYDAKNDRWRLGFTRNSYWESDLRTIGARLGYQLRLNLAHAKLCEKEFPTYKGEIRLQRSDHLNAKVDTEIVKIARSRGRRFFDIAVADEPHLFALASGVLTHNSKLNPLPESVEDRPARAHEFVYTLSKDRHYFYDHFAVREPAAESSMKRIRQATFYQQTGGQKDYGKGVNPNRSARQTLENFAENPGHNLRTVWMIPTYPLKDEHFAAFPPRLPEICIKAGASQHGVCPNCGAPWKRLIVRVGGNDPDEDGIDEMQAKGVPRQTANLYVTKKRGVPVHVGWRPTCGCGLDCEPDDLEVIASPTGSRAGDDPSLVVGRAGLSRPRGENEGVRLITRYEQRAYALQLRESPHRQAMAEEAGKAFEHYIRLDRRGARPPRPQLLDAWLERGWLTRVDPPSTEHAPRPVPPVVLDPFCGSGTTGIVALRHGCRFIGLELSALYAEMGRRRILNDAPLLNGAGVVEEADDDPILVAST